MIESNNASTDYLLTELHSYRYVEKEGRSFVVNFINVKRTNFLYERTFRQLLLLHVTRKAAKMLFIQKTNTFYADEIDTRGRQR